MKYLITNQTSIGEQEGIQSATLDECITYVQDRLELGLDIETTICNRH